jgi:glycerol uptake facilitator-like aquaporin
MRFFIGELLGTFILSSSLNFMADYTVSPNGAVNLLEIIVGFFIAIQVSRKLSGAHLNPGVSLCLYLNLAEEEKENQLEKYQERIIGQIAGGIITPLLSNLLIGSSLTLTANVHAKYYTAFIMELLASVVFYSIILFQSRKEFNLTDNDEIVSSIIVAMGLAGGISIAGNESGAGLNPVISISQNLVTFIKTRELESLYYLPIYIVAPLIAAYIANSLLYYMKDYGVEEPGDRKEENMRLI